MAAHAAGSGPLAFTRNGLPNRKRATPRSGEALRQQVLLGEEAFVLRMQVQAEPQRLRSRTIPRIQRVRPAAWAQILRDCGGDRRPALLMACRERGMAMTALAREAGLSLSHVSRSIAKAENGTADRA